MIDRMKGLANAQVVVALTTCPDAASAREIAQALVKERLATCVNRVAAVRSTYFWQGDLKDEEEILLIIKTVAGRLEHLGERLKTLHSYELPELIFLPAAGGNEQYLEWVRMGVVTERADTDE